MVVNGYQSSDQVSFCLALESIDISFRLGEMYDSGKFRLDSNENEHKEAV